MTTVRETLVRMFVGIVGGTALAVALSAGGASAEGASAFDPRAFLAREVVPAPHEGTLLGVPKNYDWALNSVIGNGVVPPAPTTNLVWAGHIHVDDSAVYTPNTRVAVTNARLLALYEGDTKWRTLVHANDFSGGGWREGASQRELPLNIRGDRDGTRSIVPQQGLASLFWPAEPSVRVGRKLRAVLALADVRLVVADARARDDRDESHYVFGLSLSWHLPNGECPQVGGRQVCPGVGQGRHIRPTTAWRVAVFHTMTAEQVATLPMPSLDNFKMPDGTYPKS